jgi:tRNA(fMet)-specific endonuclease VapC
MLVVLDTNNFSELARNSPAGRALAARLEARGAEALTTIVNAQEVTQGWCALLNRLPSGDSEVRAYSQFGHSLKLLMELPVLPFDLESSETFDRLRSVHRKIGRMDLKIASICIVNDLLLLTRNLSDFRDLSGLQFENWLD